jgi:Zn-dependent protease with chaperone function
MRYFWLGVAVLAIVAILDALEKSLAGQGVVGSLVVVLACFAVVYGWLLVEPLIDEALVSAKGKTSAGAGSEQAQLKRVLGEVARNAGMHVPRIRVYESDAVGVMVVGMGRSAVLFVNDGIAKMQEAQVTGIMAHELGHVRCGHWLYRWGLYGGLLSLAMLLAGGGAWVPVVNLGVLWVMRQMEFSADRAAAAMVGSLPIIEALRGLGAESVNEKRWVAWFSTHPLVSERIERLASLR